MKTNELIEEIGNFEDYRFVLPSKTIIREVIDLEIFRMVPDGHIQDIPRADPVLISEISRPATYLAGQHLVEDVIVRPAVA